MLLKSHRFDDFDRKFEEANLLWASKPARSLRQLKQGQPGTDVKQYLVRALPLFGQEVA